MSVSSRFPNSFDYVDDEVDVITLFEKEAGLYTLRKNETFVQHFNLTGDEVAEDGLYTTGYNFSYHYTFKFEENFDPRSYVQMMIEYYWVANYFIAAYVMAIFGIQWYMRDKQPFVLRSTLFFWNLFLAIFSTWGALRAIPEMIHLISNYGLNFTVCFSGKPFLDNRVGGFWNWMFTLSKVPELGDTIFIVLRKQPLIFLHWYHHVTVLLYSWYSYPDYIATARWFICMNYLVHSVMYTYYALKALRIRVPRMIAMVITTMQLAQMVMGTAVNIWAYQVKQAGNECHVSYENINLSLLMYTSYFVLFARFFRRAYIRQPKPETKEIKNGCSHAIAFDYDKRKEIKHD